MLHEAGLPTQFWGEVLAALAHILNRILTSSMPHTIPFEVWFKRKPDVSNLRI
jgi:hypothetical protein